MDILLLNFFLILDRDAFGYYTIAIVFLVPLSEAIIAVRDIALPYFSEKQGDKKEFYRVLNKCIMVINGDTCDLHICPGNRSCTNYY